MKLPHRKYLRDQAEEAAECIVYNGLSVEEAEEYLAGFLRDVFKEVIEAAEGLEP